ncbi:MAG: hypothetical protein K2R93_12410 [Gemmatimonadaceae bacterium]|nr:hypothetical protein [Gemmatimonadaceae bacterium]
MQLSKVWALWLLVSQVLNAAVAALSTIIAAPTPDGPLAIWKAKALLIHGAIGFVLAIMQAFAKSLTDANNDGIPDIFQGTP